MKIVLIFLIGSVILFILLASYSCFYISGSYSRMEEARESELHNRDKR